MSGAAVRRAVRDDAPAIAEVHVDSWREAYRGLVPEEVLERLSVAERKRTWLELLSEPERRSFALVAEVAGRVEGFCHLATPSRDDDAGQRTAEIAAMYIAPARWRTGLGSRLMRTAMEELRGAGHQESTLWVLVENGRARAFYGTFGFRPDGAEVAHEGYGLTMVRLRASLTTP